MGRVTKVEDFPKARNPSYKFEVDFGGEVGVKRSCAQLTNYTKEHLFYYQIYRDLIGVPQATGSGAKSCPDCGANVGEGSSFCRTCGAYPI